MKTVIIYAYECLPYHRSGSTMAAQRPFHFAKNLCNHGWRAIVLCCDYSSRYTLDPKADWKSCLKESILQKLSDWNCKEDLIIALPSLKYTDSIDRIWRRTVILDKRKGTIIPKKGIWNLVIRKISTFIKSFRGDHSQPWQPVALFVSELIIEYGIHVSYQVAEHGPDASLYIARKVFKNKRIPWIIDCRDPILMGFPKITKPLIQLYYKLSLLKSAKALINVNPVWVSRQSRLFKKPSYLITNGYEPNEYKPLIDDRPKTDTTLTITYYGNFYPFQDMEGFLKELGETLLLNPHFKEEIKFQYFGNGYDQVRSWVEKFGLEDIFTGEVFIPREKLFEKVIMTDLLLLLSVATYKPMIPHDFDQGFYPGKVFEYFGFKKPILCYPGDKAVLSRLVTETNSGYVVGSARLASFLEGFQDRRGTLLFKTDEYTRPAQCLSFANILERLQSDRGFVP